MKTATTIYYKIMLDCGMSGTWKLEMRVFFWQGCLCLYSYCQWGEFATSIDEGLLDGRYFPTKKLPYLYAYAKMQGLEPKYLHIATLPE